MNARFSFCISADKSMLYVLLLLISLLYFMYKIFNFHFKINLNNFAEIICQCVRYVISENLESLSEVRYFEVI